MPQIVFHAGDLAPGDAKSTTLDLRALRFDRIRSASDPLFEEAYGRLWLEFGKKHEMESRQALKRRFELAPRMLYEMIYVRWTDDFTVARDLTRRGLAGAAPSGHAQKGANAWEDDFIAVRDHTAILDPDGRRAVVHLSHNLVAPPARRTGLAGWMRALPIAAARECLAANGIASGAKNGHAPGRRLASGVAEAGYGGRITLVAEMEHHAPELHQETIRLRAYEKAGFRKIDPARIAYHQPDFRTPAEIDVAGGPRPLPFQLIVRRVGREHERVISGEETRRLAQGLYDMYGSHFRASDMAHPLLSLEKYPADDATIALVPPTQ